MPDELTYSIPDETKYHQTLLVLLQKEDNEQSRKLYKQLKNAYCSITPSGQYTKHKWNYCWAQVAFYLPVTDYTKIDEEDEKYLIALCDDLMPENAGFEISQIRYLPDINAEIQAESLKDDLGILEHKLEEFQAKFVLPDDIKAKGNEMAEVYLYLYVVENYIRLFIEEIAVEQYGVNYISHLNLTTAIQKGIALRKTNEQKNAWLSLRGNSDLFYLDFKDLSNVILNNWDIFKSYFPDQAWISSKINELADCRNLVAHNSYVGEHERNVIKTNFNGFVRQVNQYMKP